MEKFNSILVFRGGVFGSWLRFKMAIIKFWCLYRQRMTILKVMFFISAVWYLEGPLSSTTERPSPAMAPLILTWAKINPTIWVRLSFTVQLIPTLDWFAIFRERGLDFFSFKARGVDARESLFQRKLGFYGQEKKNWILDRRNSCYISQGSWPWEACWFHKHEYLIHTSNNTCQLPYLLSPLLALGESISF